MGKRKVFAKTDLNIPQVEHSHDATGNVVIPPKVMPPTNTKVEFGRNYTSSRNFDFARWYGAGIDPLTYACQRQIERFLAGQEGALAVTTVISYCKSGLRNFLDYCMLRATAFGRDLVLVDVNRDLIDGYLGHLARMGGSTTSQNSFYSKTKPVLPRRHGGSVSGQSQNGRYRRSCATDRVKRQAVLNRSGRSDGIPYFRNGLDWLDTPCESL